MPRQTRRDAVAESLGNPAEILNNFPCDTVSAFAGIRTFPLITLLGCTVASLSADDF